LTAREEESNKATLTRFWEEVWNRGDLGVVDEIFHAGFVDHGLAPGLTQQGPEGAKEAVLQFRNAFPDLHLDVSHLVAERDKVFTYWIATGTHEGPLHTPTGDIPATGNVGIVHGMTINRVADGRIIEAWDNFDTFGMLQQLGVIPSAPPGGGPPREKPAEE